MNRHLRLIGCNGDLIDLRSDTYRAAPDVTFGSPNLEVIVERSIFGRRVRDTSFERALTSVIVHVLADTADAHDDARQRLIDAMVSVPSSNVRLVAERAGGERRAIVGKCVTDDFGVIAGESDTYSTIRIDIESNDRAYWEALEADVAETSIGVSDSTPWVGQMPIGQPVPIGWQWSISGYYIADANAQTLNLPNVGALETWPVWEIDGPATSVELAHERTGLVTRWAGTLAAGETLTITTDPQRRSVIENTVSGWAGIALNSRMSPLLTGSNPVQVGVTGGVDGQTNVRVTSHARFTSA